MTRITGQALYKTLILKDDISMVGGSGHSLIENKRERNSRFEFDRIRSTLKLGIDKISSILESSGEELEIDPRLDLAIDESDLGVKIYYTLQQIIHDEDNSFDTRTLRKLFEWKSVDEISKIYDISSDDLKILQSLAEEVGYDWQ